MANPQGGWYRSVHLTPAPEAGRPVASVINYLVDASAPISWFHRMSADAMHYFHQGDPLAVVTIAPDGRFDRIVLGGDLDAGQRFQVEVPGGHWKAFELLGPSWALISEAVAPGWVPEDQEDATSALFEIDHPTLRDRIERFVRP